MKKLLTILVLAATCSAHTVTLSWQLSDDPHPGHQNMWRSPGCTGTFHSYARVSSTTVEYIDLHVTNGKTYCYYVTYYDQLTKETSGASNTAKAVIPIP